MKSPKFRLRKDDLSTVVTAPNIKSVWKNTVREAMKHQKKAHTKSKNTKTQEMMKVRNAEVRALVIRLEEHERHYAADIQRESRCADCEAFR